MFMLTLSLLVSIENRPTYLNLAAIYKVEIVTTKLFIEEALIGQ